MFYIQKSSNPRKRAHTSSVNEIVLFILQTFVDSCPHCPEHRREFILSNLLRAVGMTHLSKAMLIFIKKVSETSNVRVKDTAEEMETDEKVRRYLSNTTYV